MPHLFEPFTLRGVTLRNRIVVSPMCQYSSVDGFPDDWHLVHLGSRAVGGAGLVIAEASGVEARGRITPGDLGIYKDEHIAPHARIAKFIKSQGSVPGIQIAHAGRKASRTPPWETDPKVMQGRWMNPEEGGWLPIGASPIAFNEASPVPREMTKADIDEVVAAFAAAARRAEEAGYEWIEVHGAHGYLLHSFNSPISNQRKDAYGGSLDNRCRLTREVTRAVRAVWNGPLTVRISHTDWADGGWTTEDAVHLARGLKEDGADLIDVSSGGSVPRPNVVLGPGYQVLGAEAVRRDADIPVGAVGMITDPAQADELVRNGRADLVFLARELLRDPYWPIHAAVALGHVPKMRVPVQYNPAWMRHGEFSFEPVSAPRQSPA